MERFEVESGAATLAGERYDAGAPVVVALHAGVADRRAWRPVAELLGATVIAYDRRGFGDTVAPAEEYSHVADLGAVLDAQAGAGPVWLMGSSQGGRVALDFTLDHAERVAGLILVSPAISGAPEPALTADEEALGDAIDAAYEAEDLDLLNRLEAHLWLDGPSAAEGRVGGAQRELLLDMNGRALAAADPGTEREPADAMARVAEIGLPVLVVWGDLDLSGICARSAWLAQQMAAADSAVMESTAHLPYLERPADFAVLAQSKIHAS